MEIDSTASNIDEEVESIVWGSPEDSEFQEWQTPLRASITPYQDSTPVDDDIPEPSSPVPEPPTQRIQPSDKEVTVVSRRRRRPKPDDGEPETQRMRRTWKDRIQRPVSPGVSVGWDSDEEPDPVFPPECTLFLSKVADKNRWVDVVLKNIRKEDARFANRMFSIAETPEHAWERYQEASNCSKRYARRVMMIDGAK